MKPVTPSRNASRTFQLCILASAIHCTSVAHANDSNQLDPITVMGEKRERSIKETTSFVTVIDEYANNGENKNIYDAINKTPNLLEAPSGIPHIRGLDGRGPTDGYLTYATGARPRVSTTVDGVAESWTGESFGKAGMWDVEQVEVFNGPQSTIQGRNAIGGAIVVRTKAPTYHWEAGMQVGYENEADKYHAAAMLSGPIIDDQLAFRIAVDGLQGNSHIDYAQVHNTPYPFDPSELDNLNARAKLLWEPEAIPGLSATFSYINRDEAGQYTNLVSEPYFNYVYDDPRGRGTRRHITDSQAYSLDLSYDLADSLRTEFLLSQRDYRTQFVTHQAEGDTSDVVENNLTAEAKVLYQPADHWLSGLAGIYWYQRDQDIQVTSFSADDDTETQALFADATVTFTPKWQLLLGARYEDERQQRTFSAPWVNYTFDEGKGMFLPKVGLNYHIDENKALAFTVRKGYNAGGASYRDSTQEINTFSPETVWTYELSSRNQFSNGRVMLNANLFYNDYRDYQAMFFVPPVSGPWDDVMVLNIPKGYTYGAELSAQARLTNQLTVYANLGLLQTHITESPQSNPAVNNNAFSYAPNTTASLGFQQNLANGLFWGADVRYVSDYYTDLENTHTTKAGDYVVVDLNAGFEYNNFMLRAYVNNLTNEHYVYRHKHSFAEAGNPRQVGVTLSYFY